MHVLLVQPSQFKDEVSLLYGKLGSIEQPPMGLAMLAGVLLEAGFEVDIIDIDAQKAALEQILAVIDRRATRLVGLSATTPLFKSAVRLADQIKQHRPETLTCIGGYHASMEPLTCLEPSSIDFVVRGEGEQTVVELARAIEQGADASKLSQIKGLLFKSNGKPVANQEREPIADLDALPMPARHLLHNQDYSYPDTKYSPAFPVYSSRGCPGKCAFCLQHYVSGRKLRLRSAKKVADELEHLIEKYGAREIHFWDDMFSTNKKHVFEVRDEIKARKIKIPIAFPAGIRVDTATPEVLEAMKEMGGYSVAFGVESGVQEILDQCKKGITVDEVRAAVKNAKKIGLETWCFFMVGLPGDSWDTVRKTIDFALELNPDVVKFHVFKPFPGSEFYTMMKEKNLILDFDPEKYAIHTYPIHRTEKMSAEEIFQAQQEAYRRFYFRPSTLVKQVFRLNSWTRVKNNVSVGLRILRMGF
jgi:anaerobic magnesium-protoporphyrin IX monomethyl ester cyclase